MRSVEKLASNPRSWSEQQEFFFPGFFLLVTSYCVLKGLRCNLPLQSTGDKALLESGLAVELEVRMCHADHSSICS